MNQYYQEKGCQLTAFFKFIVCFYNLYYNGIKVICKGYLIEGE